MATKTVYVIESNLLAELAGIGRFSMIDNLKKLESSITKAGDNVQKTQVMIQRRKATWNGSKTMTYCQNS